MLTSRQRKFVTNFWLIRFLKKNAGKESKTTSPVRSDTERKRTSEDKISESDNDDIYQIAAGHAADCDGFNF